MGMPLETPTIQPFDWIVGTNLRKHLGLGRLSYNLTSQDQWVTLFSLGAPDYIHGLVLDIGEPLGHHLP
jgi:hypothetical protein